MNKALYKILLLLLLLLYHQDWMATSTSVAPDKKRLQLQRTVNHDIVVTYSVYCFTRRFIRYSRTLHQTDIH